MEFRATGDILSTNVDAVRAELDQLFTKSPQPRSIALDLSAARLIDSVGLNLIVSVLRRVKQYGGSARIKVGHPTVRRMMAFTRIDQHAEVVMV